MGNDLGRDYSRTCTGGVNPVVMQLTEELDKSKGDIKKREVVVREIQKRYNDKEEEVKDLRAQIASFDKEREKLRKEMKARLDEERAKVAEKERTIDKLTTTMASREEEDGAALDEMAGKLQRSERAMAALKEELDIAKGTHAEHVRQARLPYSYSPMLTGGGVELNIAAELIERAIGNINTAVALLIAEYRGVEIEVVLNAAQNISAFHSTSPEVYMSVPVPLDCAFVVSVTVRVDSHDTVGVTDVFDKAPHAYGEIALVRHFNGQPKRIRDKEHFFDNERGVEDWQTYEAKFTQSHPLVQAMESGTELQVLANVDAKQWMCHMANGIVTLKYVRRVDSDDIVMNKNRQHVELCPPQDNSSIHDQFHELFDLVHNTPYRHVPADMGWDPDAWMDAEYVTGPDDTIAELAEKWDATADTILALNPGLRIISRSGRARVVSSRPTARELNSPLEEQQSLSLPQDERQKFLYYHAAANDEQEPKAMYHLSLMYAGLDGVVRPEWEVEEVINDPDRELIEQELLEDNPSDAQEARHDRRHINYLAASAKAGWADAQYLIGTYFKDGSITKYQMAGADSSVDFKSPLISSKSFHSLLEMSDDDMEEEQPAVSPKLLRRKSSRGVRRSMKSTSSAKDPLGHGKQALYWLRKAATQGHPKACELLATMYIEGDGAKMSYKEAIQWYTQLGLTEMAAKRRVFTEMLSRTGSMGSMTASSKKACYQVAMMHLYGIGTPLNFDRATLFFTKAGKSKKFAKQMIDKRFAALKKKYQTLFDHVDEDGDGHISRSEFSDFYVLCLMAKGLGREEAEKNARSLYQGKVKATTLFLSYDVDHGGSVDFDEIWDHPHTHTNIVPHTEAMLRSALSFFARGDLPVITPPIPKTPKTPKTPRTKTPRSHSKPGMLSSESYSSLTSK